MKLLDIIQQNVSILPTVLLALSGFVIYLIKDIPLKIINFIISQFTLTINLHGGDSKTLSILNDANVTYYNFLDLLSKIKYKISLNKIFSINHRNHSSVELINDLGIILFYYKNCFFICKLWKKETKGDQNSSEFSNGSVTMIGKNHSKFISFISEFYKHTKEKENLKNWIHGEHDCEWEQYLLMNKRNIDSVIINQEIKNKIISTIENFSVKKDWYDYRSIPYKLIIVLHGPPGTGKTSLIRALATYFNRDIRTIDLTMTNINNLKHLMFSEDTLEQKNPFFLIEDFTDSAAVTFKEKEDNELKTNSPINLSQLLNLFDGINSLNGSIVFLTTNHLENINPAFLRKGRVDYIFEIGFLNNEEIKNYIYHNFPDFKEQIIKTFKPISGAELQSLFHENNEIVEDFINSIPLENNS